MDTLKKFAVVVVAIAAVLILSSFAGAGTIDLGLQAKLDKMGGNETIKVFVTFKEQADYSGFSEDDYAGKYNHNVSMCNRIQEPVERWLKTKSGTSDLKRFTVVNAMAGTMSKSAIQQLANLPEVGVIIEDVVLQAFFRNENYGPSTVNHAMSIINPVVGNVNWDVAQMQANRVWDLGFKGQGVVIGVMDTGLDPSHPLLAEAYQQYRNAAGTQDSLSWFDAINSRGFPYDDGWHGTGCAGFIVGANGIGVAPKAKIIACKVMTGAGTGTVANFVAGFNWFYNLPDSHKPRAVSNSWGFGKGGPATPDSIFYTCLVNWKSKNILPIFAIGNEGDANGDTLGRPGNQMYALAVGATDPNDDILYYSCRGPSKWPSDTSNAGDSVCWWPSSNWYRTDWNYHKPDIAAPADPTVTTAPLTLFQDFNGTSAATPHVAGQVALMLSKNPNLTLNQIYQTITDNAFLPFGDYYNFPNDTFGWGRADAFKAVQAISDPTTPNIYVKSIRIGDPPNAGGGDRDGEIDPAEATVGVQAGDTIVITLANNGASAQGVQATLVSADNSYLPLTFAGPVSYGTMNRNSEFTPLSGSPNVNFRTKTNASLPTNQYVNLRVRITATTPAYLKNEIIKIFVPLHPSTSVNDTLIGMKDDGDTSGAWIADSAAYKLFEYFASKFYVPDSCTFTSLKWIPADAGVNMNQSTETLFVWADNNNKPNTSYIWCEGYDATTITAKVWNTMTVTTPPKLYRGEYWIGMRKAIKTSGGSIGTVKAGFVPCQDRELDNPYENLACSTYTTGRWYLGSWWYDFNIRPRFTFYTLRNPMVRFNYDYKIDDTQFGNGNGYLEPNEQAKLSIGLKNYGVDLRNVTATITGANDTTNQRITFIDNTSNFGIVRKGQSKGHNMDDPFVIKLWADDTCTGWYPYFKVVITGNYDSSNAKVYKDSIYFRDQTQTLLNPHRKYTANMGAGYLSVYYDNNLNNDYVACEAQISLNELDTIWVDSVRVYTWNDGPSALTMNYRIWKNHYDVASGMDLPGDSVWATNVSIPAGTQGVRIWIRPNKYLPGIFWYGHNLNTNGTGYGLCPITHDTPLIANFTLENTYQVNNWSDLDSTYLWDYGPVYGQYQFKAEHPILSYYCPAAMDWPIVPSNTPGGSNTVPATLSSKDLTYIKDFSAVNRSDVAINVPAYFNNILFLDYYGIAEDSVQTLGTWGTSNSVTNGIMMPGGRHTLLGWLDWDYEVTGNVFTSYMRTWAQQYSWTPSGLTSGHPKVVWAPIPVGTGSGPYYNVTAYACTLKSQTAGSWGTKWWNGFATKPLHTNEVGDSIDMDLMMFRDAPTTAYNGYTQIREASLLGPGKVDFIVVNQRKVGNDSIFYPAVYHAGSANWDDAVLDFERARSGLTVGGGGILTQGVDSNSVIHVYDVKMKNDSAYTITVNVIGGNVDIGLALFGNPANGDTLQRRTEALVIADATGPGGSEVLNYTPTGMPSNPDTLCLVVFFNNLPSGSKAPGGYNLLNVNATPLAVVFAQMAAMINKDNTVTITWRTESESNTYQWRVERATDQNGPYLERGIVDAAGNSTVPTEYTFTDGTLEPSLAYYYRLAQIDLDGATTYYGPIKVGPISMRPLTYELGIAKPNPFNSSTAISYQLKDPGQVSLKIYNIMGQMVKTLVNQAQTADFYSVRWNGLTDNGTKAANGIYFYKLQVNNYQATRKMIMLR